MPEWQPFPRGSCKTFCQDYFHVTEIGHEIILTPFPPYSWFKKAGSVHFDVGDSRNKDFLNRIT